MGAGVIELENISYTYCGGEFLSDVSLELQPGSFHFMSSPSGADKTTLLKLYYGALPPIWGQFSSFGDDIAQPDRDQIALLRRRIGVVHQDCRLLDHMAVPVNVTLPLMVSRCADTSEQDDLFELRGGVGLGGRFQVHPPEPSGGDRQRTALARPVILQPDMLLANEPARIVDWKMSQRLLIELNRIDKTVPIANRDLSLIRAVKNTKYRPACCGFPSASCNLRNKSMSKSSARYLLHRYTRTDRVVLPSEFSAQLTLFVSGAIAFLVVFALTVSLASDRLADRRASELAGATTLRVNAPTDQRADQTKVVLLSPWFETDLPPDTLPVPQLNEIIEGEPGLDATELCLRSGAEIPGTVLDEHTNWCDPLVDTAMFLRLLGWISILLIGGATVAMITLAANSRIIRVLRQVGMRDCIIAGFFVRRFTFRALIGATVGPLWGISSVLLLPDAGGLLTQPKVWGSVTYCPP